MTYRTDRNNNPTAFTTAIARQAGLTEGIDFIVGESFDNDKQFTAKLLGDPIAITLRVIDKIGFVTKEGKPRWVYINIFSLLWRTFSQEQRKLTVHEMYKNEGGTELEKLFV